MSKIKSLSSAINSVLVDAIKEINEVRIPALEVAWGRTFKEELENEDQKTVEIAKNYSRIVNNCIYRRVKEVLPDFKEHTTNGSDYILGDLLIEDKNSFSDSNGWVGNGFDKTPVHLLKKFICDENGRIISAFVAIVDLGKCKSAWSDRQLNTNRSVITFSKEDLQHIEIVFGDIKENRVNLKPILKSVI